MYSRRPGLILGFHGCDKKVRDEVILGKSELNRSRNSYDWLGHGMYFWENSPARAMQYAKFLKKNPQRAANPIKEPAVLAAVIDLGHCLDLLEFGNLALLKEAFDVFLKSSKEAEFDLPANKIAGDERDFLLRDLDCAVIEVLHEYRNRKGENPFDSVRSVFLEGRELYHTAGFREKTHIQICIRNPNCIKGYFIPRQTDSKFSSV